MDFNLYNGLCKALNWLLPIRCVACNTPLNDSSHVPCCDACYTRLPLQSQSCRQCGQRLLAETDLCGSCLSRPPHFDQCFCPFAYSAPISDLIIRFKYHDKPELAGRIAALLAEEILAHELSMPEVLLPVPMHISRLRSRGYNQSALLAYQLGKILKIPVDQCLITKVKATPRQAELSLKQRQKNLNNSFSVAHFCSAKSVAIVDDVVTTGSTAREIAKILKKKGVDYIQVWGVAHTL